ncbi:MAG: hypothetical protein D6748_06495 [Calditrichaeota bacterium]|nr:MAG: hypothetical protein D6748_06495 [Calditrichota bacterium]
MKIRLVIFSSILLIAQVFGGSYFHSRVNSIGVRTYTVSVRGLGMGNTGLAATDSVGLNHYMPAQWRFISDTRASFSMSYLRFQSEVNNLSFTTSTADFGGVTIAIPIKKRTWIFGLSLKPYTVVDFKATQKITSEGKEFTQITQFNGSVSEAKVNLTWAPSRVLGLAISANYYFGAIDDRYDFQFNDANYINSTHVIEYQITGAGVGISGMVQPLTALTLAGFVDFQPTTKMSVKYNSLIYTPAERERNFNTFPMQLGLGSQLKLNNRWQLAADYTYQDWAKTVKQNSGEFEKWYQMGMGIERSASKKRGTGLLNHIDWRLGFSLMNMGYQFNNHSVQEKALHFGFGIPFSRMRNRFDVAFLGGIRGDKSKNLAEEWFFKAYISISMGERWFQSFR